MANDPASAGHERERGASGAGSASTPGASETPAAPPPNLTQELAHLLAASIAQSQAGRGQTSGAPTGSDLASLASLMASAQATRPPAARYRDELSSLTYLRPHASPPASLRPADGYPPHAGPEEFGAAHHDDEPMPIPSTWRQPAAHDEDRPFTKQLGAAALGLVAGLVVVVPAVLWLAGWVDPQRVKLAGSSVTEPRASDIKTVKVRPFERPVESATFNPSDVLSSPPAAPEAPQLTTASMMKAPSVDASQQIEHLLVKARQRIDGGDVQGARELLAADGAAAAPLLFALAETYDPNMLAAWGSRGVSADVQRARALYARALDLGFGRAMARLDALK